MKAFLALLIAIFSIHSFAVTVKTKIPRFSGNIQAVTPGLDITSVKIEIENHFCSIGTCAGGPVDLKNTQAEVKISSQGDMVSFSTSKAFSHSSFKIFGNFADCSIKISATARTENGTPVDGVLWIASTRNPDECSSESIMGAKILNALARPIKATAQPGNVNTLRLTPAL